eukprot:3536556-Rhodomonas_salina.2
MRTDARYARDIVGAIASESLDLGHLIGADAELVLASHGRISTAGSKEICAQKGLTWTFSGKMYALSSGLYWKAQTTPRQHGHRPAHAHVESLVHTIWTVGVKSWYRSLSEDINVTW